MPLPTGCRFHVFMAHDWGIDEHGRPNHDRVKRANAMFKARGLLPWFDEEMMQGALLQGEPHANNVFGCSCVDNERGSSDRPQSERHVLSFACELGMGSDKL